MQNNISEQISLEVFHSRILCRFATVKNSLLKSINLNENQYIKLTSTEEGKQKLKSVLEKKPELRSTFIRLETLKKMESVIENEFKDYLPF